MRSQRLAPLIVLLGSIVAIGPLSIDLYLPAFPELTRSLDASESMVQLSLTTFLVGLAFGQVLIGPLSDAIGRRRPLLAGMGLYVVGSVLAALAPSIELLAAARGVQGLGSSAGAVLTLAVVRDLFEGPNVARVMSRLILVMGVAPVFAPSLGGQLLGFGGWRGIFWMLAATGAIMAVVIAVFVKETLPDERRQRSGVRGTLASYRNVVSDRRYLAYAGISVLGFVLILGYVAGAPFAYQNVYDVSPQVFGVLFGANAVGMVIVSQINARLVMKYSSFTILRRAVPVTLGAALVLVLTTTTGAFGLVGLGLPLAVMITSIGLVLPNAGALALNRHPESAGAAAALVGMSQFAVGSIAGPIIGLFGGETAVPMAVVIAIGALGMASIAFLLSSRDRTQARTAAVEPAQA